MEGETKQEKQDYYNDYDEYVDDAYYNADYKTNIKHDRGATKFKKVPLHKITLETEIPEEPHEKHDKPNDSHYEKELKRIDAEIEKHKKNREDLFEKLKQEKIGRNPELSKCHDTLKEIKEEMEPIDKKIEEINERIKGPLEQEKKLKTQREKYEKEVDIKNYEKMQWEIEQMQEQLGFGTLSASDEKKIMEKKSRLEVQLPKCKKLNEIRESIKKIKGENTEAFAQLKQFRDKKTDLINKRKTVHAKIDVLKTSVTENQQAVNQIKAQIDSVKAEIQKLNKEYYDVEREYNEKWRKYEEFKKIVDYIKDAKKKQNDIKKREEKMKKKAEKDAKKEGTTVDAEINIVSTGETEEFKNCKRLIAFFESLQNPQEQKTETKVEIDPSNVSDKLNEDLKKGNVVVFNRDAVNNDQVLGIEGKEKKKKGPKISKREQKALNTDLLILDVEIVSKIKSLGLNAPDKKSQVDAFIKTLETKRAEIEKAQQESTQKAETKEEEPQK